MPNRYFRRGVTKIYWVPTISAKAAPTASEVTAGTDMTPQVDQITGFTFNNTPIAVPDLSSVFDKTIPGPDAAPASALRFYELNGANPLQTTLAKGTAGYVVIFWNGTAGSTPASADKCEVWPAICTGYAREYSLGNDPARWHNDFSITDTPAQGAAVA